MYRGAPGEWHPQYPMRPFHTASRIRCPSHPSHQVVPCSKHGQAAHCVSEPWQPWQPCAETLQYTELCTTHLTDPRLSNLTIILSAMRDLMILAAPAACSLRLWPPTSRLLGLSALSKLTHMSKKRTPKLRQLLRSTNWPRPERRSCTRQMARNCHPHKNL